MKLAPLEIIYLLVGVVLLAFSLLSFMDEKNDKRWGTGLFWLIYSISFIFGSYLSNEVNGWLVIALAVIVACKQLGKGYYKESSREEKVAGALRIGNRIFLPALLIGLVTFSIGIFTKVGALVGLAIAAVVAMITVLVMTKESPLQGAQEGRRLIDAIGWTTILSQLLAALGALFNASGVGKVIFDLVAEVIPVDNTFLVVIAYCFSMALFTMIMGNAFAAFAMITSGIGIPMLAQLHGANPAVIGPIAMLSGYCGTLLTPMAANFNVVPVALLEMKDENGVIKLQIPIAITLLAMNILFMYYFAF